MDAQIKQQIKQLADYSDWEEASQALIKIGPAAIEPLCQALADKDQDIQDHAVETLVKFGSAAVEPLCRAFTDRSEVVRERAAEALGKIKDPRAIEPLFRALADSDMFDTAAVALSRLGDVRAVEPLCRALADKYERDDAAVGLQRLGDADTLPLKVLQEPRLTPQQRFEALEALRHVKYKNETTTLRFPLPDIPTYCQQLLQHPEEPVRRAAQEMLDASSLLRGSYPENRTRPEELVRPAVPSPSGTKEQELLRASSPSETETPPIEREHGLPARFRKWLQ